MIKPRLLTHVVPLAVLLAVLGVYLSIDVQIHFFLHLFLGGTTALLIANVFGLRTGRFPPALVIVTIGAVVNAVPDVLYLYFHVAHAPWMDLFQWHIETHFMVGFPTSWYLIFLLALAAYFAAQVIPASKPALRAAPLAAVVAVVMASVVYAHERVPEGVISADHPGHLIGWVTPLVGTAIILLPPQFRRRRAPAETA